MVPTRLDLGIPQVRELLTTGPEMRHRDLVPNVINYIAAISSWHLGQTSESALRLTDEMRHGDLVPDVIDYSAFISARVMGRVSESALHLVDEMRHQDLVPNWIVLLFPREASRAPTTVFGYGR